MKKNSESKLFSIINIILFLSAISLSISISAMEIGLGLLLPALLIFIYKNGIDPTKDCPYFIPFFVYWLTTLLPFFLGSDKAVIESNAFDVWPMLYIFAAFYFVSAKNLRPIFFCIALGVLALSISVISDVVIFHKIRGDGFLSYMTGSEILALGGVLALGLIVSGYEQNKLLKIFYGIVCLASIAGIIFTETRGSLISFLITACFMLILRYGMKGAAISVLLTAGIGAGVYLSPIGIRFFEIFKDMWNMNTSHGWRFELWTNTITLIKEYPIFGIGNGAYPVLIKQLIPPIDLPTSHAHNGYLVQLVLFGIVGFLAFCWFYGKIIFDFIKNIKSNNFAFIGFAIVITYAIQGITENNFQDSELVMFSSFTLGILLGAIKNNFIDKTR